jgi:hypothetical protein
MNRKVRKELRKVRKALLTDEVNDFYDLAINYNAETSKFFKFDFHNLKRKSWDYLMPFWAMHRK